MNGRLAPRTSRTARHRLHPQGAIDILLEDRTLLSSSPFNPSFPVGSPPDTSQFTPIPLTGVGHGSVSATFAKSGDIGRFWFAPSTAGQYVITLAAAPGSQVHADLSVEDSSAYVLGSVQNDGTQSSVLVTTDISSSGDPYFIQAYEGGGGTGAYSLQVQNVQPSATLRVASGTAVLGVSEAVFQDQLESPGAAFTCALNALDTGNYAGNLVVSVAPTTGSYFQGVLSATDDSGHHYSARSDGSLVILSFGANYTIQLTGAAGSTGGFRVTAILYPTDDIGSEFDSAYPLLGFSGNRWYGVQQGFLAFAEDTNVFSFPSHLTSSTAKVVVRLTAIVPTASEPPVGDALDGQIRIFDDQQRPVPLLQASSDGDLKFTYDPSHSYYFQVGVAPDAAPVGQSGAFQIEVQLVQFDTGTGETLTDPASYSIGAVVQGTLEAGETKVYQFSDSNANLEFHLQAPGFASHLSLLDNGGQLITQSDAAMGDDNTIDFKLGDIVDAPFYLEVSARGGGSGAFTLSSPPYPYGLVTTPYVISPPLVVGDFTGHGRLDAVDQYGAHLGRGNGTFGPIGGDGVLPPSPYLGVPLASGDFFGDGHLDVVTFLQGTIAVARGHGDGTFDSPQPVAPGVATLQLCAVGDFTGNGEVDLATVTSDKHQLVIFLGRGDGTFTALPAQPIGDVPAQIVAADFRGDGRDDLATVQPDTGTVAVFLNLGGGTFAVPVFYTAGSGASALVAADLTGDGRPDLATADSGSNAVSVLLNQGDGTFASAEQIAVGTAPTGLLAGDLNGDGHVDLMTAAGPLNVSSGAPAGIHVLLGQGDGRFTTDTPVFPTYESPRAIGDFTGDGRLDLLVGSPAANDLPGEMEVLIGQGDGTFQTPPASPTGHTPVALVAADFNGDGVPDLAVGNADSNDVTILLGRGDGTFATPETVPVGSEPVALVAGDFNGDGRIDLAVADRGSDDISILLGRGDGTFLAGERIALADPPRALVAADFRGDGILDLIAAEENAFTLTVLHGRGDGTFEDGGSIPMTDGARSLVAADFNNDGHLDLAAGSQTASTVSVFLNRGDGTFGLPTTYDLGTESGLWPPDDGPVSLVAGDFFGDGQVDLATANPLVPTPVTFDGPGGPQLDPADQLGGVTILPGLGDGRFAAPMRLTPPSSDAVGFGPNPPAFVALAVLPRNGYDDLAALDAGSTMIDIYHADTSGSVSSPTQIASDTTSTNLGLTNLPRGIVSADFTHDGRADLAYVDPSVDSVGVELDAGAGAFLSPGTIAPPAREVPLLGDLFGTGVEDLVFLNSDGSIEVRRGRPNQPGTFDPPQPVNPGAPAVAMTLVRTEGGLRIAAVFSQNSALALFNPQPDGSFTTTQLLANAGSLPTLLVAGDFQGQGYDDLLVYDAASGTLTTLLGDGTGRFTTGVTTNLGRGVSQITTMEVHGTGRLDLLVADQIRGDVSVYRNQGGGNFVLVDRRQVSPFATSVTNADPNTGNAVPIRITSPEATAGVVAGLFTAGPTPDLVTINPGSNSIALFAALPDGGYAVPRFYALPARPVAIRVADLEGDGQDDAIVLTTNALELLRPDGAGGFAPPLTIEAGLDPSGFSISDVNGDGKLDVLVGNPFGDVLVLLGNGDGTFQPWRVVDRQVTLAVADLKGNGQKDFVFADAGLSRVSVQYGGSAPTILGTSTNGLLAPGAVQVADLNSDGILDLIVANSGANDVLVYPGLGNGQFGPALNDGQGYFTGSDPVGVTVADVDGDGRPDLVVANYGSNDVSVLLNRATVTGFTFVPGPRLRVGSGPVSTVVQNVQGQAFPNLLVSDSLSNQVTLLRGVGGGFFDDQHPTTFAVGDDPGPVFVGHFTSQTGLDLVTLNAGTNDLTLIPNFATGPGPTLSIGTGGLRPVAGLVGDFRGGGFDDLIVANNGDGLLALLLGSNQGLTLFEAVSSSEVPEPTALAAPSSASGELQFFAATEGQETATLLSFVLPPEPPAPDVASVPTGGILGSVLVAPVPALGAISTIAQLSPLNEQSLALVGTVLSVSLSARTSTSSTSEALAPSAGTASVSFLPGAGGTEPTSVAIVSAPGLPNQLGGATPRMQSALNDEDDASPEEPAAPPTIAAWLRSLLDLNGALDQARRELLEWSSNAAIKSEARPTPPPSAAAEPAPPSRPAVYRLTRTVHDLAEELVRESSNPPFETDGMVAFADDGSYPALAIVVPMALAGRLVYRQFQSRRRARSGAQA